MPLTTSRAVCLAGGLKGGGTGADGVRSLYPQYGQKFAPPDTLILHRGQLTVGAPASGSHPDSIAVSLSGGYIYLSLDYLIYTYFVNTALRKQIDRRAGDAGGDLLLKGKV